MESSLQSEGGYSSEGILGYPWTQSAKPGLVPILRTQGAQSPGRYAGNHALISSGDALHAKEALADYAPDGTLGYGYARYPGDRDSLVSVSAGGVTIKSNADTGGSVWEWLWHGKQFINDYDYGRQLSMAVYAFGKALQETGDKYGGPKIPVYNRHPSPTLYVKTSGNEQSSRAVPIDWSPDNLKGGKDNAVIYPDVKIGKDVTLNWVGPDGVDRNWPVVLYESVYEGPAIPVATIEAPTAYLTAEFTTYYKYDPVKDELSPIKALHTKVNVSGGGANGLIVASGTDPNAIAFGVYENDPNAGIVLFDNSGPGGGQYGSSFSKWGVLYRSTVRPNWKFRTWMATDTVPRIKEYFRQLYLWKVTSRDSGK